MDYLCLAFFFLHSFYLFNCALVPITKGNGAQGWAKHDAVKVFWIQISNTHEELWWGRDFNFYLKNKLFLSIISLILLIRWQKRGLELLSILAIIMFAHGICFLIYSGTNWVKPRWASNKKGSFQILNSIYFENISRLLKRRRFLVS